MAEQAAQHQQALLADCPGFDSTPIIVRVAAISGASSATLVIAIFVFVRWLLRRRATHAATATAPPPPPPPPVSPAPPPTYLYTVPDFYAPAPPPTYTAPAPAMYAPPTPLYAPPASWANITVNNNNHNNEAGDIEMAALGYAAAAGTSAAGACVIM